MYILQAANRLIPEPNGILRGETCGIIELPSPPKGVYITFLNTLFPAAQDRAVHQGRADPLALILFPGADRLDQRRPALGIHIDKAVGADIVCLTGIFIHHNTLKAVRIQGRLFLA